MRLLPALVVVSTAVVLGLSSSASAQLVRITADGSFEHIENEEQAPDFLPAGVAVAFTFELNDVVEVAPLIDGGTTTYVAKTASLKFGDLSMPLHGAMFEVSHGYEESQDWTSYLLTGETGDGWRFFLQNVFATPSGGSALFPVVDPGELIVYAITLSDEASGWAAFGDGVVRSIVVQPVPEPATFAMAGAVLAVGLIARQSMRRRVKNPAE
jgi:hypothetical protein